LLNTDDTVQSLLFLKDKFLNSQKKLKTELFDYLHLDLKKATSKNKFSIKIPQKVYLVKYKISIPLKMNKSNVKLTSIYLIFSMLDFLKSIDYLLTKLKVKLMIDL